MSIVDFLSYLQHEKRYSNNTVKSYQKDLDQLHEFLSLSNLVVPTEEVTNKHIRSWLIHLISTQKLSVSTVKRKSSVVRSYFNWLVKKGSITFNPANNLPNMRSSSRVPQYLSKSNINDMLKRSQFDSSNWVSWMEYLIIELFYTTGIRRQELIDLEWNNVDFNQDLVKVKGKGGKERIIPVPKNMIADLNEYRTLVNSDFDCNVKHVFITRKGKKLYPKYVYNTVKRYVTKHSTLKKRSPHILRHTFATHLLNEGAGLNDIKELLGHSSLAATQVYTHSSIEDLKKIYKQAHPKS